jgi:hypothetical protein
MPQQAQMDEHVINIAREFSRAPAGRFISDGPNSGERLRNLIAPFLENGGHVSLQMDGTRGYGSSFLDAAFGGLVRDCGFHADDLIRRVQIVTEDPSLELEIKRYWTRYR